MKTIKFNKDEKIKLQDRQFIFLSDGTGALHLYMSDLKEEYSFIKTWKDLINSFTPLIIELYNIGVCYQVVIK